MSKNFLNFLTTSVIILSCGTTINGSSCYCMESEFFYYGNLSLIEMNKKLQNEIKEAGLTVDKTGHIIIDDIDDDKLFNQTDWLRNLQVEYSDILSVLLQRMGVSEKTTKDLNNCMTYCLNIGSIIGNRLKILMCSYVENNYINKNSFLRYTNELSNDIMKFCLFQELFPVDEYYDNNDHKNLIKRLDAQLFNINTLLNKVRNSLLYYNSDPQKCLETSQELSAQLPGLISNCKTLLSNTSSSNNDQRKKTHDSFKKDLMSQLSNIISGLQQLDSELFTHANDTANLLQAISASQPMEVLTKIMKGTGETVNINTSNIPNIILQQLLNYVNNTIHLISITCMQNIKEYLPESITNNTINEEPIIDKIMLCGQKVLSIVYNFQEYLSIISTENAFKETYKNLAKEIINENIKFYITKLKNLKDKLQQMQDEYNNNNIKNIKQNINNIKQIEDKNITEGNNNSIQNNTILHAINNINNGDQMENIKQQVEDSNIKKENNNSVQSESFVQLSKAINNGEQVHNFEQIENSKNIKQDEDNNIND